MEGKENLEIAGEITPIVQGILKDYQGEKIIDKLDVFHQPDKDVVIDMIQKLFRIAYPGYFKDKNYRMYHVENNLAMLIEDVIYNLSKQIAIVLKYNPEYQDKNQSELTIVAQQIALKFASRIPKIREYIDTDLQATFEGDPAAENTDEIIYSYPGLFAITVNRFAHELYLLSVPVLPRIMTEYAHGETGIDIHPGATIGKYFFIDHGTGIVIGESTIIGEHVKIYQGVTLGALSTRGGQSLRNKKRHPTIEDYVTIYSGASILGGETVIGKNVVIGGNAFITSSVKEGTRVSVKNQELEYDNKQNIVQSIDREEDEAWFYII
ncbi:MAG: serine acetyltransferase [Clostridiales bacterium]|nr:serine acetyltransferase [Clostridiales bacterium]